MLSSQKFHDSQAGKTKLFPSGLVIRSIVYNCEYISGALPDTLYTASFLG